MRRTSSWRIWGRLQSASESGWRSRAHSPGAGAPRTDIPGAPSAEEHAASAFLGRPQLPPPPPLLRLPYLPPPCPLPFWLLPAPPPPRLPHPPRPCSKAVSTWTLGHMGLCGTFELRYPWEVETRKVEEGVVWCLLSDDGDSHLLWGYAGS